MSVQSTKLKQATINVLVFRWHKTIVIFCNRLTVVIPVKIDHIGHCPRRVMEKPGFTENNCTIPEVFFWGGVYRLDS